MADTDNRIPEPLRHLYAYVDGTGEHMREVNTRLGLVKCSQPALRPILPRS